MKFYNRKKSLFTHYYKLQSAHVNVETLNAKRGRNTRGESKEDFCLVSFCHKVVMSLVQSALVTVRSALPNDAKQSVPVWFALVGPTTCTCYFHLYVRVKCPCPVCFTSLLSSTRRPVEIVADHSNLSSAREDLLQPSF